MQSICLVMNWQMVSNIGVQLGGGKWEVPPPKPLRGGKFPPLKIWSKVGTAKFPQLLKLEKKSYWPYLRVLHPVEAIYIHSPSISIQGYIFWPARKFFSPPPLNFVEILPCFW